MVGERDLVIIICLILFKTKKLMKKFEDTDPTQLSHHPVLPIIIYIKLQILLARRNNWANRLQRDD